MLTQTPLISTGHIGNVAGSCDKNSPCNKTYMNDQCLCGDQIDWKYISEYFSL